jgi:hypothetical protein
LAIHDDGRPQSLPISSRHYAWAEGLGVISQDVVPEK